MRKELFKDLLPPLDIQISYPTCIDSDARWGLYCMELMIDRNVLTPIPLIVKGWNRQEIKVAAIQKNTKTNYGTYTYLVIRPDPGLLISHNGVTIQRPLMKKPHGDFIDQSVLRNFLEERFDIQPSDHDWYIQGMIKLLSQVVKGGINADLFRETLESYSEYIGR